MLVCAAKELLASDWDLLGWINNKIQARTWINNKIRARPPPWTSRAPSAEALTKHTASVALQSGRRVL
ncbi:hypothetical protein PtA15_15A233 [Puccinia triticina]|uniref:Uncharacterized protein n=1 Tax=Puccinia triticina TaxID=208348 RepID=A0ABY7D677_9BASI|nr:uncharacterized protein PtA15_15A233 [Puccinia triticina]WAQ91841.1 hypothetical protein PtA15_15A233 [Puccinia triticina]